MRHHLAHDLRRAPLVALIENRPNERDRDRLDAFLDEEPAGGAHVVFVQRRLDRSVRDHPLAHAFAQIARHQHDRRRVFGIVAVAVLLVAEPDLDRILMAGGADQAGLAAFVLDQRVEPDGRAVDAEVGIRDDLGGAFIEIVGDQFHALFDRAGGIGRRRQRLVQANVAGLVGQDQVGEGAAGIDAEAIFGTHDYARTPA